MVNTGFSLSTVVIGALYAVGHFASYIDNLRMRSMYPPNTGRWVWSGQATTERRVGELGSMATPVLSEGPSVAHKTLRKHYRKLVDAVSRGQIAAALYEKEVVEDDVIGLSTTNLSSKQIGEKIMKQVLQSIKLNPMLFESFCEALETESVTKEVVAELKGESV